MNKKTYIGLTIGPIVKTISNARETGELWGSSYIFSYIMKSIIYELIKEDENRKKRFISPYVEDNLLFETLINRENGEGNKAGLFHDRFIFESKDNDFEAVEKAIENVKLNLATQISEEIKVEREKISKFIDNYFKIYFLEITIDLDAEKKEERNIIKQVSKCLDVLELREVSSYKEEKNYLEELLVNSNIKKGFLTKDAQGRDFDDNFKYQSIPRIGLKEFDLIIEEGIKNFEDRQKVIKKDSMKSLDCTQETNKIEEFLKSSEFHKLLKEKNMDLDNIKKRFKKAYEYVAIVQIDGDSMGKAIETLTDIDSYKDFSKSMLEYSKNAYNSIYNYGGFTVYAGGDDILFLAPIINRKTHSDDKCENIFQLFDELDSIFKNSFEEYIKEDDSKNPSISIGVAVVNNKYPLYLGLDEARSLLFEKAKTFKFGDLEKNAIAFKVIKSSGESFESIIGKGTEIYDDFKELFNRMCFDEEIEGEKSLLNQIHIKLLNDKVILKKIAHDKIRLKNYFENNFNEEIHKKNSIRSYLDTVMQFIYKNFKIKKKATDEDINNVYACLKFIRFMNEKSELFYTESETKGGDKND